MYNFAKRVLSSKAKVLFYVLLCCCEVGVWENEKKSENVAMQKRKEKHTDRQTDKQKSRRESK
jgi:hypothetical protein